MVLSMDGLERYRDPQLQYKLFDKADELIKRENERNAGVLDEESMQKAEEEKADLTKILKCLSTCEMVINDKSELDIAMLVKDRFSYEGKICISHDAKRATDLAIDAENCFGAHNVYEWKPEQETEDEKDDTDHEGYDIISQDSDASSTSKDSSDPMEIPILLDDDHEG